MKNEDEDEDEDEDEEMGLLIQQYMSRCEDIDFIKRVDAYFTEQKALREKLVGKELEGILEL